MESFLTSAEFDEWCAKNSFPPFSSSSASPKQTTTPSGEDKRELLICTPCHTGTLSVPYFQSILEAVPVLSEAQIGMHINTLPGESLITRARNVQVAMFLKDPQYTHLLFIDNDIGFDAQAIIDLIDSDLDVVGCPYPLKQLDFETMSAAVKETPTLNEDGDALQQIGSQFVLNLEQTEGSSSGTEVAIYNDHFIRVHETGTGFLLIKRKVIEDIAKAHPELKHTHACAFYAQFNDWMYALFESGVDEKQRYLSEDWNFCKLCRDTGYHVYLSTKHWGLTHTGTHTFRGNFLKSLLMRRT